MDVINNLVGGQGCAVDGTVAARNPMSKLLDSLMEGSAATQKGRNSGGMPPGAMQQRGHHPAHMDAMRSGMPMGPHGMAGPFNARHLMSMPPPSSDAWAAEFQRHGPAPPPHMMQQQFENAWAAEEAMHLQAMDSWAQEFQHHPIMMERPPPHMVPAMMPPGMGHMGNASWEGLWMGNQGQQLHGPHMGAGPQHYQGGLDQAWEQVGPQAEGARFEEVWDGPAPQEEEVKLADAWEATETQSFSDAWAGLDSGREEDPLSRDLYSADPDAVVVEQQLEEAWEEAQHMQDPELDKIWDEGDTMEGVWSHTASALEAMRNGEAAYEFKSENDYLNSTDPFAEGLENFEQGNIPEAIQCFEAELQRNPDNAEAWRLLGQSHAENDQDRLAIACLERSVDQDPYSLEALLALGVSYVNELDSEKALKNLKAWVEHNPKYSGLEIRLDEYSDGTLMDEVMQLMLQAEQWDQSDPDAKTVLGVLYNVSRDYHSAAEAFRSGLQTRPHDYSLWNKLGATLANNNCSQEALPAYERALDIKPKYARAWLNMGISQANLNRYSQAAACYLKALSLNPDAKHIWAYLRIVFTCMERFDLVQRAASEDVSVFTAEFDVNMLGNGLPGV